MKWRRILIPFSLLFLLGVKFRDLLYKLGLLKSVRFDFPVVVIGNLSTGGTGKTPHVESIIKLLKDEYKIGVLSRGYGRKSKGIFEVEQGDNFRQFGDEPLQIKNKFKDIPVFVSERRIFGIPALLTDYPETELVLLDDAYQHKELKASSYILLSPYSLPYTDDLLLPAGNLRELPEAANRADLIIISKCPLNFNQIDFEYWRNKLKLKTKQQLLFSKIEYAEPQFFDFEERIIPENSEIIAFAGLADNQLFFDEIRKRFKNVKTRNFPDHHNYNKYDIKDLLKNSSEKAIFICTEKDFTKLNHADFSAQLDKSRFCFLPLNIIYSDKNTLINHIKKIVRIETQK